MSGTRTLQQTEQAVGQKLGGMHIDMAAMTALSNLFRTASTVRNHFEQSVLKPAGLTWSAFVVLWVIWIWESLESRHVAQEAGINKGTLTGVIQTLEGRELVTRTTPESDRRRALLSLTPKGERLMAELFPAINDEEQFVVSALSERRVNELGSALRGILTHMEENGLERRASG